MADEILDNASPVDMDIPGNFQPLLRRLQGNIITDHGRDFANHIFFTFTASTAEMRKWLKQFSPQITSAWQQHQDAIAYRTSRRADIPFISVFLSAAGYEKLALENRIPVEQFGRSFRDGMRSSQQSLQDIPSREWDDHWNELRSPAHPVHGMILIGNDNENTLATDTDRITTSLRPKANLFVEKGKMWYQGGDTKKPQEHFGYVDGISNPIFTRADLESADGYQPAGGAWRFSHWDPFAPLRLALVRDPAGPRDEPCFGSFLVFRKLEQNVRDFRKRIQELSADLGHSDPLMASALVMGRFPNGTPLTERNQQVATPPFTNDFACSAKGGRCPIRGHIRRVTPRGDTPEGMNEEKLHRIVRRGITYGERREDFSDSPPDGVGLLFMCYQSDISSHFEHIQKEWCNWDYGRDSLIAQGVPTNRLPNVAQERNTEWPKIWANTPVQKEDQLYAWPDTDVLRGFDFGRYVTLKGGEYFFAPSIPFFQNI